MFVFRNSIGLRQHHRLMYEVNDIDFGNGGGGNSKDADHDDKPAGDEDTDGNKDNPDDKDKNNPDDKDDDKDKDGNKPQPSNPSTGGLEQGTNVEFEGVTYTVDKDGNLVDADGKVFKEAKDVDE